MEVIVCVCMYVFTCICVYDSTNMDLKNQHTFFRWAWEIRKHAFYEAYSLMEIMKSPKLQDILIFPFIN